MEEVTIISLAEEMGIKPKEVKQKLDLPMTTPGDTALTNESIYQ